MKEEIFQFHIALIDSIPPIWRRFQVNSQLSFDEFHDIIQVVMGWENAHLYEFKIKDQCILMPETESSLYEKAIQVYGDKMYLHEMLKKPGEKFRYTYDFGDDWQHEILFEKRLPAAENQTYPLCIEGENSCPPEDCGGLETYYNSLEFTAFSEDLDEKSGPIFSYRGDRDLEYFNLDEINKRLAYPDSTFDDESFFLEEKISNYLDEVETPFRLEDCLETLSDLNGDHDDDEIRTLIITSGEVVPEKDLFYPKISFLKDFAIRITPDEFEIETGVLIPGHRLMPFLPYFVLSDEAQLTYKDRVLENKEILLPAGRLDSYCFLLDTDELPILPLGFGSQSRGQVALSVTDLSRFYKENNFDLGDSIILKVEDFGASVFSLQYDSAANIKDHKEEIKAWDDLFTVSAKKVLEEIETSYLENQLMYVYYFMSLSMTAGQKKIPGTEVGILLSKSKEIGFSDLEDVGKILHLGSHIVVNLSHKDT
ncbi:MAG: plasmid pRiA4b ORF-3 family protein [Candidatus Aminicenantes bacterium]|nr:plasmid pRiA4b ORF-3 family protein [Candidatus Aminicenantes bacterium]